MMSGLLNLFRRKLVVKLFALVGATILWFFVMSDQNPVIDSSVSVPVTIVGEPENCVVTPDTRDVRIKLRGARSVFAAVRREEIKASVDLTDKEPGTHHLPIQTVLPQGLEAVSLRPEYVDVLIDPILERRMPISLIQVGSVGSGFTVSLVTPETDHVVLKGPQSRLDSVTQVVGYVGLSADRTTDFDIKAGLSAVDADGRPVNEVTSDPGDISVHIQLARGLSKKIVDIKPIFEGTIASGYAVTDTKIDPPRVEIAGDASALEKINALETEPIALSGLTASARRVVNLILPEGVTVTNRTVMVTISIVRK